MRWCGPEVEVEGIVSLKTGGCPEDCHFCSQSGLFDSPVRAAWLDIPGLVDAAKQTAATGASEFCIVAAVRGPDERLMSQMRRGRRGHQSRGGHQRRRQSRDPHPRAGRRAQRDGHPPLQPQPRDRQVLLPERRHHPHLGRAVGHPAHDRATPAWRSAAAASSAWARRLEQRAEFAAQLAQLDPHEVPLNFLNPRPGTPFADQPVMSSADALRTIAAFRLALPRTILRYAGGREITLGDLGHARRPARRHQRRYRRQLPDHAGPFGRRRPRTARPN